MNKLIYHPLTEGEIAALEAAGCRCANWDMVTAAHPFRPNHYRNVTFSGRVQLGTTEGALVRECGIEVATGIYDATVHNITTA